MKTFLLASLRQTITPSATPLIETIQSVISSRRTLTAIQPLQNETEIIDQILNEVNHVIEPQTNEVMYN